MRIGAGLLERGPLPHAEAVLLVDHYQPQLFELRFAVQNGMSISRGSCLAVL